MQTGGVEMPRRSGYVFAAMGRKRDRSPQQARNSVASVAQRDRAARRTARRASEVTASADQAIANLPAADVQIENVTPGGVVVSAPVEGAPVGAPRRTLVDAATRARAAAVADAVRDACAFAEERLAVAVTTRDEQQMAWLVLCDRGWPSSESVPPRTIAPARAWLAHWTTFVAMPVKIGLTDRLRLRSVQQRLAEAEQMLRPALPPSLWQLVQPLDDTGRATLAHALHAIVRLDDATAQAEIATREKAALRERFSALAADAAALGLDPPQAPLDLDTWRALASAALELAGHDDGSREIDAG